MSAIATLAALALRAIPGVSGLARRAWCTRQRTDLRAAEHRVVWVRDGEKLPWAFWGANHGFFELEWAGHLPYLRAMAAAD